MELKRYINQLSDEMVHVLYTFDDEMRNSILISDEFYPLGNKEQIYREDGNDIEFLYNDDSVLRQVNASLKKKNVYQYIIDGEPILKKKLTANGEVSYIENAEQRSS